MDNLSIIIKALLEKKSKEDIIDEIKQIQNIIDKSPLKIKIDIDNAEFKRFSDNISKLNNSIANALNTNTSSLDKVAITMNTTNKEYGFMEKKIKEITDVHGNLIREVSRFKQEVDEAGNAQTVLTKRTEETITNYKKQREEAEKLSQSLENFKLKMLGNGEGVAGQLDIFAKKQKGRYDKSILDQLRKDIEALTIDTPNLGNEIKKLEIRFSSLKMQAAQSGNVMVRALENAYKFLRFYLVGGFLVRSVNEIKKAINSIIELDTSLTELNKVVDISNERISKFVDEAYELGNTLGRTGKQVIDATTEFARAGYILEESFKLSKAALLMMNVAEGINTVEEASSSLISVLRSYKMEVSDAVKIVDILNAVSNTSATNFDNLSEGLRRTAGTLSQTGASLEELTGLLVGGFEPLRNIEQVSSGLLMISQRLRGIGEDGEAIEGLMPKLQEDFMRISNISIIDPETGGLRSTFDILQDMAKVFPTLTDMQRQYLSELAAGNRQVKVLNAILDNWENVEKAVKNATTSTGSAMKESEKFLNSIQGKLNLFSSAAQSMWNNVIDSNVIKFFIDLGTIIIKLIDRFGLLRTTVVLVTSALLLFNKGFLTFYSTNIASHFLGIANALKNLMLTLNMTTAVANATATAFAMIAPIGVFIAITGIIKLIGNWIDKQKQLKEEQETFIARQSEKINTLKKENEEISSLIKKYDELKNKTRITAEEKEELHNIEVRLAQIFPETADAIDKQNQQYTTQIDLVKQLAEEKRKLTQEEMELFVAEGKKQEDQWKAQRDTLKRELQILEESRDITKSFQNYYNILINKINQGTTGDTEWYNILDILQKGTIYQSFGHPDLFFDYMEKGEYLEDWRKLNQEISNKKTELNDVINKIFEYYQARDELLGYINNQQIPQNEIPYEEKSNIEIYLDVPDRDRLKKLLDANKITLQQYYDGLLKIRTEQYSEFINKSASELNKLLQDPAKAKTVEAFLSLESDIQSTYDKLKNQAEKENKKEIVIEQKKLTNELIKYFNVQVEANEREAKTLEYKIKTLEQQEKYNDAIQTTNKLIDQYYKTIDSIRVAQQNIHAEANKLRQEYSQYDIDSWFADAYGTPSKIYIDLIESFDQKVGEGAKKEREIIEEIFNRMSALKKAYMDGIISIQEYEKSINSLKLSIEDLTNDKINKEFEDLQKAIDPLTKQFDDLQFYIDKYNQLLEYAPEQKRAQYLDLLNKFLEEQKNILKQQNTEYEKMLPLLEQYPELYDKIKKAMQENIVTIDRLTNLQQKNIDTKKKDIETSQQQIEESLKKYKDARISIENEILDILKENYRKSYELKKEEINKKYDLEIESLNRLKELMSRNRDEEKYQQDQEKRYKELEELQKRYQKVLLDPTARKERIELEQKIADKTNEIKEAEIEHSISLETDRIDDLIKLKQEAKERELKSEKEKYNDFLSDARNFQNDLQAILRLGQDEILAYLMDNSSKYKQAGQTQAEAYAEEWRKQLELLAKDFKDLLPGIGGGSGGSGGDGSGSGSYVQMWHPEKRKLATVASYAVPKYVAEGWTTNVPSDDELRKIIEDLGGTPSPPSSGGSGGSKDKPTPPPSKPTTVYDSYSGRNLTKSEVESYISDNDPSHLIPLYGSLQKVKEKNPKIFEKWEHYKSLLSSFDFGGLALGKGFLLKDTIEPERILSPTQTKIFDRLVNIMDHMPLLKTNINPVNITNRSSGVPAEIKIGDIHIHVQNLQKDADFDDMGNKVFKTLSNKIAWGGNVVLQGR